MSTETLPSGPLASFQVRCLSCWKGRESILMSCDMRVLGTLAYHMVSLSSQCSASPLPAITNSIQIRMQVVD